MGRIAGLGALAAGLAAAQYLAAPRGWLIAIPALLALWVLSRRGFAVRSRRGLSRLATIAILAFILGLGLGEARVAAIDGGAMGASAGSEPLLVRGYVTGSAWRERDQLKIPLSTPEGRVMVVAGKGVLARSPPVGRLLEAEGRLTSPSRSDELTRARLRRIGISHELHAERVELLAPRRGGFIGLLDAARTRAERGLAAGLDPRQADLARGFVLGGDDRIDPAVEEDFRRTGLSHLLAVSGQNVMLLAALAGVALGLAGLGLRARLLVTILLIALYVPITGAGASIQRAAVMGSTGLLCTVFSRPSDRLFTLLAALAVTLLINPRFTGDVGWQLSFAAVIGIGLWAGRIRRLLTARRPFTALPDRVSTPLAEAIGITVAATIATAPLLAFTFERLSPVSLLANVAVAPAVAPTMWLGMVISFLAQFEALPLVPQLLTALGAVTAIPLDYISAVADHLAAPSWAEVEVEPPPLPTLVLVYACLAAGVGAILAFAERREGLRIRRARLLLPALLAAFLIPIGGVLAGDRRPPIPPPPADGSRLVVLDVGQGDATLLLPRRGLPVLVDAGPADADVAGRLRELGVDHLGALLLTHDHADHVGGAAEVLARIDVDVLGRPLPIPTLDAIGRADSARVVTLRRGRVLRSGGLRLEVLWPTAEASRTVQDPNASSLVLLARMSGRRILLSGDAEQEMTYLRPGPVDVLKIAHHGSADSGLEALLVSSSPSVATISSGEENDYGHPAPETTDALADAAVCTLRTDEDGTLAIDLDRRGIGMRTEEGTDLATRPGCAAAGSAAHPDRSRRPP